MKRLLPLAFVISSSLVSVVACTSTRDQSTAQEDTPKENIKEGWENIKEGSSDIAEGVGDAAANTGESVVEGTKDAGRALKASSCPVIGNRNTQIYYTQTHREYNGMLKGEKLLEADNRECFLSEQAALSDGYTKAR